MVKAKKGKKEVTATANGVAPVAKQGANADNEKLKIVNEGISKMKLDSEDSDDSAVQAPSKQKSKAKKSDFDLLMDDDDDSHDDAGGKLQEDSSGDEAVEISKAKPQPKKTEKKGKKSKRRNKADDDDDLDDVLAELRAEYEGTTPATNSNTPSVNADEPQGKSKKSKKNKPESVEVGTPEETEGGTVKTAAQKKKEKKERQKIAKQQEAQQAKLQPPAEMVETAKAETLEAEPQPAPAVGDNSVAAVEPAQDAAESTGKTKNKKKSKKEAKPQPEPEKKEKKLKGISALLREQLQKKREEEERLQKLEEERIRQEEERERLRLEAIRLEAEKKAKKKQRELERKARLKAEGKLLTKKQKEDRARAQLMIEARRAQGLDIPDLTEKRVRPGTRIRPNKKKLQHSESKDQASADEDKSQPLEAAEIEQQEGEQEDKVDKVKDSWDASDTEDEEPESISVEGASEKDSNGGTEVSNDVDQESEDSSESDSESESESDDDAAPTEDANVNDAESRRLRAEARIKARQSEAESKRTTDELRAAVICVMGHVDTGKTKILDKLRRTNVQDSEAGGITQQIGATNVPIEAIENQTRFVKKPDSFEFRLPGLLIIDTPGHESFRNLRSRGSSLCDFAILVVDIMHGLEAQTLESIKLLREKRCPFIVALNKIDRLLDWKEKNRRDVADLIKEQEIRTQNHFHERTKKIMLEFQEQGLNTALIWENSNPREYISLVPTSAHTGEGMGNLLFTIVYYCQQMLSKRLMYSEELQATVLEVKAIHGLGTTIDAILINGRLREGQTVVLAGTEGPIVTTIRSLLMPQPMKELRVKNAYIEYKEIKAAQGVKIAAKDLEKAIAGINLLVAHNSDEIEICKRHIENELNTTNFKLKPVGVYVQASTLGSLEALLDFLQVSKIPVSATRIGPVVKRDIMKASIMLEHKAEYATILAFDVKIEHDAQELADNLGVKIFKAEIIYHLENQFTAYLKELNQKKRDEFNKVAVFPCRLSILKNCVFNTRDPIVVGVKVLSGIVRKDTPICVPTKDFVDIGVITSIQYNHKEMDFARRDQEICIKIDAIPGEPPRALGRHFTLDDMLVSKISRESIDACKAYFREDLAKADWILMSELKKQFGII